MGKATTVSGRPEGTPANRRRSRNLTVSFALAALAALAGFTAACSSSEQGSGSPASHGNSPSSSSPSSAATTSAPATSTSAPATTASIAHPVELKNVRPCTLFDATVSSIAHTGGDDPPFKTEESSLPDASGCFQFNGHHNVGLTIIIAPKTDIDRVNKSMTADADVQRFTINGYPAVTIGPHSTQPVCFGGVGMHDHELVYLRYGLANPISTPKVPQRQLCARLRPIAEHLVSTLTH